MGQGWHHEDRQGWKRYLCVSRSLRPLHETEADERSLDTYIIPRKSGDVIIGGTADAGDWERTPRPETTQMIKERGIALCPELLPEDKRSARRIEDLDVIEEGCGLRPTRKGGIRLEIERIGASFLARSLALKDADGGRDAEIEGKKGETIPVVHNYGHGGYGFQSSWGSARLAVELLKEALA